MSEYIVRIPPDMPHEIQIELNAWYIESEPIVRCKDCRFYEKGDSGWWCKKSITLVPDKSGFCAWGEKIEEGD